MKTAEGIAQTQDYRHFVDDVFYQLPERFRKSLHASNCDYLCIPDQHLELVPCTTEYGNVLDIGRCLVNS